MFLRFFEPMQGLFVKLKLFCFAPGRAAGGFVGLNRFVF